METEIQCHLYLCSPELYLSSKVTSGHVHLALLHKYVAVGVRSAYSHSTVCISVSFTLIGSAAIRSVAKTCNLGIILGCHEPFSPGIASLKAHPSLPVWRGHQCLCTLPPISLSLGQELAACLPGALCRRDVLPAQEGGCERFKAFYFALETGQKCEQRGLPRLRWWAVAHQAGITGSKAEELACEEAEPQFWQGPVQTCAQLENIRWEDRLVSKPVRLRSENSQSWKLPSPSEGCRCTPFLSSLCSWGSGLRNWSLLILHFSWLRMW